MARRRTGATPLVALLLGVAALGLGARPEDEIAAIAREYIAAAPETARALLDRAAAEPGDRAPSRASPFVFFHLRKSAGTLIRKELVMQAQSRHLRTFVPCHSVPCDTYGTGDFKAAVIGGHLYFAGVEWALRREANPNPRDNARTTANFSCFTILRKPSSRVESCWNFRFRGRRGPRARAAARIAARAGVRGKRQYEKPFIAMTVPELRHHLPLALDEYGHGCNNEALRIFADAGHAEVSVNWATAEGTASEEEAAGAAIGGEAGGRAAALGTEYGRRAEAAAMLSSALRNMGRCVVGVLERCEETAQALSATYPWIPPLPCKDRSNSYGAKMRPGGELAKGLSYDPRALAEVRRQNVLEEHAYAFANAMLDAQLAELRRRRWPLPSPARAQPDAAGRERRSRRRLAPLLRAAAGVAANGSAAGYWEPPGYSERHRDGGGGGSGLHGAR